MAGEKAGYWEIPFNHVFSFPFSLFFTRLDFGKYKISIPTPTYSRVDLNILIFIEITN